jgi:hypothetical protein
MMIGTWLRRRSFEDDQVEAVLVEALQCLMPVGRRGDVIAVFSQRIAEQGLNGLLVVNKKDSRRSVRHLTQD